MLDIYIYNKLKEKYPKKLWFRNNASTIMCNCVENYFFNFLAFVGIFSLGTIFSIATTTTIFEIIINRIIQRKIFMNCFKNFIYDIKSYSINITNEI